VKDTNLQDSILYASQKGYRTAMTAKYMEFVQSALNDMRKAWDENESVETVFEALDWPNHADDQYGNRKWVALVLGEDELRISVFLTKRGQLQVDYREFYTRH
jgi:hypothetical protein